jgi:hypothetical protein
VRTTTTTRIWLALSIGAVIATPILLNRGLRQLHEAAYTGTCGPHAPDINAHPCTFAEYAREFGEGFAGFGLLMMDFAAAALAAAVVAFLWLVRWIVLRQRPPAGSPKGDT